MPIDTSEPSTKQLLAETATYEILGQAVENAYFHAYHTTKNHFAKEQAMTAILKSNLRFVLKLAIDYHKITGLPITDFYAEGKLGLIESFHKFDYTAGIKFSSFAVWEINRHMKLVVTGSDMVRVPIRQRKRVLEAMKRGIDPSTIKYGKEAAVAISGCMSIEQPVEGDNVKDNGNKDVVLGDIIPDERESASPEHEYSKELIRKRLDEVMESTLSPDENKLLRNLYGLDGEESNLTDVATELSASKEWIRRAKNKALAKLRNGQKLDDLKEEMD